MNRSATFRNTDNYEQLSWQVKGIHISKLKDILLSFIIIIIIILKLLLPLKKGKNNIQTIVTFVGFSQL